MSQPRPRTPRPRDQQPASQPSPTYRAARLPSGALLSIEVCVGRRVLRTIGPDSEEGRTLLRAGKVEIVVTGDH